MIHGVCVGNGHLMLFDGAVDISEVVTADVRPTVF